MKASEVEGFVVEVKGQVTKAKDEIVNKIAALEDSLRDMELPGPATSALNDLKVLAQALDDIVPDQPPEG